MTDLPKWLPEMYKCDYCKDIGIIDSVNLREDIGEPRVEVYYNCKCGKTFGYYHTGRRVDSYKKYLAEKKD